MGLCQCPVAVSTPQSAWATASHLFNRNVLSTSHIPDPVVCARDPAVTRTDKRSAVLDLYRQLTNELHSTSDGDMCCGQNESDKSERQCWIRRWVAILRRLVREDFNWEGETWAKSWKRLGHGPCGFLDPGTGGGILSSVLGEWQEGPWARVEWASRREGPREVVGQAVYHVSPLGLELPQREVGSFGTVLSWGVMWSESELHLQG